MPWSLWRPGQSSARQAISVWNVSLHCLSPLCNKWSSKLSYSCNPVVSTVVQIKHPELIRVIFCEEPITVCHWLMWHLLSNTSSALKLVCSSGKNSFFSRMSLSTALILSAWSVNGQYFKFCFGVKGQCEIVFMENLQFRLPVVSLIKITVD